MYRTDQVMSEQYQPFPSILDQAFKLFLGLYGTFPSLFKLFWLMAGAWSELGHSLRPRPSSEHPISFLGHGYPKVSLGCRFSLHGPRKAYKTLIFGRPEVSPAGEPAAGHSLRRPTTVCGRRGVDTCDIQAPLQAWCRGTCAVRGPTEGNMCVPSVQRTTTP